MCYLPPLIIIITCISVFARTIRMILRALRRAKILHSHVLTDRLEAKENEGFIYYYLKIEMTLVLFVKYYLKIKQN